MNTKIYTLFAVVFLSLGITVGVRAGELPAVRLNEVVSNPLSGEKEWVELYNAGDTAVDLSGWKLTDLVDPQGTPTPETLKALTGSIEPGSYLVVEVGTTKRNNAGDSVGLLDASGAEVDRVTMGPNVTGYTPNSRNPGTAGMSAARLENAWVVSETSKGAVNIPPSWFK